MLDDVGMRELLKKKEQDFSLRNFNFDLTPTQDIYQIAETFIQKAKEYLHSPMKLQLHCI